MDSYKWSRECWYKIKQPLSAGHMLYVDKLECKLGFCPQTCNACSTFVQSESHLHVGHDGVARKTCLWVNTDIHVPCTRIQDNLTGIQHSHNEFIIYANVESVLRLQCQTHIPSTQLYSTVLEGTNHYHWFVHY